MLSSRFAIFRRPRRPVEPSQPAARGRLPGDNLPPVASLSGLELMALFLSRS
ncbi:hypothetical protein [Devosia sp.]|uniref:hypothetical protein n=1 Tax=Devosia sp. TaxID=1871048 RepID=UPI001AC15F85|nr:hypothetical protein [Devosia sp.]MBN9310196.1 hypothetical protein [Devosia sp.]